VLAKVSNYHLQEGDLASSNDVHMKHLRFPYAPQKGGSKIPLRNFANWSNSCVARSLCYSWATCNL